MKKCRVCRKPFEPFNSLQVACSPECALQYAKRERQKAEERKAKEQRKWVREQRAKLKTRRDYVKEAQQAFNAYIRARDVGLPCISCDRMPDDNGLITGSRIDAGHYRSVGSCPELRFEELNCHAQCVKCNQHLSGNTVEYRIRLKERIGEDKLAWLEGPHEPKHYSIDDLKAITAMYRRKKRELEKMREAA
ncbi:recombination protein NinG [Marinobacter sp.]|uniref:recombination protein NinG n=1 Tax=Marinobacter sp. TaxID=50741 RepID=UPI00356207F7